VDCSIFCRDDWIRTSDPLHPMQVRYRAALRPERVDPVDTTGCKSSKKIGSGRVRGVNFFL
jgi:hypothetical protein